MANTSSKRLLPTLAGTISNLAFATDVRGKPFARMTLSYTSKAGVAKRTTAMAFSQHIEKVRASLVEGASVRFSGLFDGGTYKVIGLPAAA